MEQEEKIVLVRIILSAVLLGISFFHIGTIATIVLCCIAYLVIGYDVIWEAIKGIVHGEVFDEHFLMMIATIGAFCLKDFKEAVAVMLFYQVGELLQDVAVEKSKKSILQLMDLRPDYANVEKNGKIEKVSPESLKIGDVFIVNAGEKIALDGEIVQGQTSLNTTSLTGESLPVDVGVGDSVVSGSINISGTIKIRATKLFGESTASKIVELVENSENNKAKSEKFITKFAKWYTPIVVILATVLAVVPSLITHHWAEWIGRALIFLVISCPCALVVSIPLSFFAGIGGASKKGILVKGANHIETLANTKTIAFDKTGTLTKGNFALVNIHPVHLTEEELVEICALAEYGSSHPIATSIREYHSKDIDTSRVKDIENLAGLGIKAKIDGKLVYVGNKKLMESLGLQFDTCNHTGTTVHVAIDNEYAGHLVVKDELKDTTKTAVDNLKSQKIDDLVMLTGDKTEIAMETADFVGMTKVYTELLPQDKVAKMQEIKNSTTGNVMYVGDGINDAPVMKIADCAVAMGGVGSDVAIESADIVLMDDNILKIPTAIKIAKKTMRLVKENIIFALGVKVLMLALGAFGIINMWGAVFADVGVSLLAILNALRALKSPQ